MRATTLRVRLVSASAALLISRPACADGGLEGDVPASAGPSGRRRAAC